MTLFVLFTLDFGPSAVFVWMILVLIMYIGAMVLISPAVQFVIDNGSLKIAQGMGPWRGLFSSMRDISHRRRTFVSYYFTMVLVIIASVVFFPLATFIQWVIPVLTRAFLVANDDLTAGLRHRRGRS
jgi:hypothetical protein